MNGLKVVFPAFVRHRLKISLLVFSELIEITCIPLVRLITSTYGFLMISRGMEVN